MAVRGSRLRPTPPPAGAAGCGQGPLARGGYPQGQQLARGDHPWVQPAVASPQGTTANDQPARGCPRCTCKGLSPAGAAASATGVAAPWQGSCRPQRAASSAAQGQLRRR
ncbi:hypothetical protein BHE74_00052485 [Ensete ventricosum]|nr:hypothetical protein BHE74_00052485 [Ensete ventricosum]